MIIGQLAIYIVLIAAIIALVVIALKQFNVAIPQWVVHVFWVVVVAIVIILAIKFLMSGSPLLLWYLL